MIAFSIRSSATNLFHSSSLANLINTSKRILDIYLPQRRHSKVKPRKVLPAASQCVQRFVRKGICVLRAGKCSFVAHSAKIHFANVLYIEDVFFYGGLQDGRQCSFWLMWGSFKFGFSKLAIMRGDVAFS